MSGIVLRQLEKRFGTVSAVDRADLHFRDGELTALLGPSGCGKTTLIRMIAGLERPTSGSIYLDDVDITERAAHQRRFGMVFQSFALFPHLSVADNVAYSLRIRGVPLKECRSRARDLLELVQMPDFGSRRIGELSGGQRQRVAIARALAQEPSVFLLDEPMSALDARLREDMQVELRLLQQRLGITTIVVTHDQREAMTMADRIVVMNQGQVEQVGTPDAIYDNPSSIFVASFIGKATLLNGTVRNGQVVIGEKPLQTRDPLQFVDGAAVTLFSRPERNRIVDKPGPNTIEATVSYIRNVGPTLEIQLATATGTVLLDMPNRYDVEPLQLNQPVIVQLPDSAIRVFPLARAA
jgi:putative spermidine/putrescine transport system ATP-binding protein